MADHKIIIAADDQGRYLDTRPLDIPFHIGTSPSFEWQIPEALLAWLDIANARVELRDQLRKDELVVDAEATLDNTSQTIKFTLTNGSYPIRSTRYKLVLEVEKTDATYIRFPLERPGFIVLRAHAVGEDPLSLDSTLQELKDAETTLGVITNLIRNPVRLCVVDNTYEGFDVEGVQYGDPNTARLYAIDYLNENGGQFNIIVHSDGTDLINPDRTTWGGYTPHAQDANIIVTSAMQLRNVPHRVYEADWLFKTDGLALANDDFRYVNTFPSLPTYQRLATGVWRISWPTGTFDQRSATVDTAFDFDGIDPDDPDLGPAHVFAQVDGDSRVTIAIYKINGSGFGAGNVRVRVKIQQFPEWIDPDA